MDRNTTVDQFDVLIIGGGPAGLSAAVTLGRGRRTSAVFDSRHPGRSDWKQINRNYLGFPDGIAIDDLNDQGREQARNYGAALVDVGARSLTSEEHGFVVSTEDQA